MIAIDLDGTLLNKKGVMSPTNAAAIAKAQQAGVMVVPCTGRSWIESRMVLDEMPRLGSLPHMSVYVGGAMVSDWDHGHTLDIAVIEPHLVREIVDALDQGPDAVLVFRDANITGHDYLITGHGKLSKNTQWWFETTNTRWAQITEATLEDLHHAMRIGIVTTPTQMKKARQWLEDGFKGKIIVQSFAALPMPNPQETVHVLEVFAAGVDKWRGLRWIAEKQGIATDEIAVMGDEINDVSMLSGAGCPIAMDNAIDVVKAKARYITRHHEENGVAFAIEQLLSGKWV